MKLSNELIERLNRACKAAGRADDDWNLRFRNAVDAEGLTMIPEADARNTLSIHDWLRAPHEYSAHHGWHPETAIVVKEKIR